MLINDLKPCPFCGGKAELVKEPFSDANCSYDAFRIQCTECGCGTDIFVKQRPLPKGIQNAVELIERWNRRATDE